MKTLILIGFRGAGKTSTGKKLAIEKKIPFYDSDDLLREKHSPHQPASLFECYGREAFQKLEYEILCQLKTKASPFVLATGALTALPAIHGELLMSLGEIVHLQRSQDALKRHFLKHPPIYAQKLSKIQQKALFERLYEEQMPLYKALEQKSKNTALS